MPAKNPVFPIVDGHYRLGTEPRVRIGIVLAEDAFTALAMVLPPGDYEMRTAGAVSRIRAGQPRPVDMRVDLAARRLVLRDAEHRVLLESPQPIRLTTLTPPIAPRAGDGIAVKGIVAGRGFHWQKRNDQTLTGALEFRLVGDHLVMINELPLEEYLTGVITGEMSGECPIEFMKAQATAARSWLLAQPWPPHADQGFIWCNDDCCQRYQGTGGWSARAVEAIAQCRGQVLMTPTNQYCDARYSKSTGGISEDGESVWQMPMECLGAVVDAPKGSAVERFFPVTEANIEEYLEGAWLETCDAFASPRVIAEDTLKRYLGRVDEAGEYWRWKGEFSLDQLRESMAKRGGIDDMADLLALRPIKRGRSGRIEILEVDYRNRAGAKKTHAWTKEYDIRAALSSKFLYSSLFIARPKMNRDGDGIASLVLSGGGWGHGAGLCQIGALGRALKGQAWDKIVTHYYPGARLEKLYE